MSVLLLFVCAGFGVGEIMEVGEASTVLLLLLMTYVVAACGPFVERFVGAVWGGGRVTRLGR